MFCEVKIMWEVVWKNQSDFSLVKSWYDYKYFFLIPRFTSILIAIIFIFNVFNILSYVCAKQILSAYWDHLNGYYYCYSYFFEIWFNSNYMGFNTWKGLKIDLHEFVWNRVWIYFSKWGIVC